LPEATTGFIPAHAALRQLQRRRGAAEPAARGRDRLAGPHVRAVDGLCMDEGTPSLVTTNV
jgi:hypothetical protein